MSATSSIRADAKQRLYDLLRLALSGVQVSYSEPYQFEARSVWLGETAGTMAPAQLSAGRKRRSDEFTISVHCLAYGGGQGDGAAMDGVVSTLFAEVEGVLADSPTLAVDGSGLPGLNHAYLTEVTGPNPGPFVIAEQAAGFGSEIIARAYCNARLT